MTVTFQVYYGDPCSLADEPTLNVSGPTFYQGFCLRTAAAAWAARAIALRMRG